MTLLIVANNLFIFLIYIKLDFNRFDQRELCILQRKASLKTANL